MIYQYLDHLMAAYLNQDYDLSGETPEQVVQCYLANEGEKHVRGLMEDCFRFKEHNTDIESKFEELYSFDFNPKLWGITAECFLNATFNQAQRYLEDL